jgi:hypothetical protein
MTNLTEKLRQLIKRASHEKGETAELREAEILKLVHLIDDDATADLSCEATFSLLDEFAELVATDEATAVALMPLVKHHLDKCGHCSENFNILLEILGDKPITQ